MIIKNHSKLKIYLADLVYDTVKTNFVVPLNIAYVAAYVQNLFPDDTQITLFKYPTELEKALRDDPPDILGLSYYSWNERLCHCFLDIAKEIDPKIVTVMGGPNIRTENHEIQAFLAKHPYLDYYIVNEGEEPFGHLIESILGQKTDHKHLPVPGCASLGDNELLYTPINFRSKSKEMIQPSPYLTGLLDPFLKDPDMIPLLETNRGCPFGCSFCAWGVSSLSKIRIRPLEQVYDEIEYIRKYSAKQKAWIFCDANFGILHRDIDIANRIRSVMDQEGFPAQVTIWHAKNTSQRNIEIVKSIGGTHFGYVALQSTDLEVLKNSGRGTIKLDDLLKILDHYKKENIPVSTDILIGLAGESADSHRRTLLKAFDLGFEMIKSYNIRLLPGTEYESDAQRSLYGIRTKFRPIFGSYGTYGGRRVFELEESVRSTKDMTEEELNGFKIFHWLIYFAWNGGVFKPLLNYGRTYGINPGHILHRLTQTSEDSLRKLFNQMLEDSLNEWFETQEEMLRHYQNPDNFQPMIDGFMKLNFLYIARVFQSPETIKKMENELIRILTDELKKKGCYDADIMNSLVEVTGRIVCKDLLDPTGSQTFVYPGNIVAVLMNDPIYQAQNKCSVEIVRSQDIVNLCRSFLADHVKEDGTFSLHALVRFFEGGGIKALTNKIKIPEISRNKNEIYQEISAHHESY